jgi:hypothetical protein
MIAEGRRWNGVKLERWMHVQAHAIVIRDNSIGLSVTTFFDELVRSVKSWNARFDLSARQARRITVVFIAVHEVGIFSVILTDTVVAIAGLTGLTWVLTHP